MLKSKEIWIQNKEYSSQLPFLINLYFIFIKQLEIF